MGKKLQMKDYQALAAARNGACIHPTLPLRREKVLWRCEAGHEFAMRADNVKAGGWCPQCSGRRPWTLDLLRESISDTGIECISSPEELKSNKSRLRWVCEHGHEWRTALVNVVFRQSGCPHCANKAESWAREVFEDFFNDAFPKCRPEWLEGLELDGYGQHSGRAFEFQGRQHYEVTPFFGIDERALAAMQARDERKAERCRQQFVLLYVIRHHPRDCYRKEILQAYVEHELVAQLLEEQRQFAAGTHWLLQYLEQHRRSHGGDARG